MNIYLWLILLVSAILFFVMNKQFGWRSGELENKIPDWHTKDSLPHEEEV